MSETIIHRREHQRDRFDGDFEHLKAEKTHFSETDEQMLERYAELTFKLISKVHESYQTDHPIDTMVFLDKSARPVMWMMRELWPLALDESGEVPEMPEIRLVNIDREPWRINKDSPFHNIRTGELDNFKGITQSEIEGLRMVFAKRPLKPGESPMDVETYLDGKNILIVDEIEDTGDTTRVAKMLFEEAFPGEDRVIDSHAWMNYQQNTNVDGTKIIGDIPVWYTRQGNKGRLIKGQVPASSPDANKKKSLIDSSHQFLSTRDRMRPRLKLSSSQKRRLEEITVELKDNNPQGEERRKLIDELNAIKYIDERHTGQRLRLEMGKLALKIVDGEISPLIENPNVDMIKDVQTEDEYFDKVRERKGTKKK